MKKRVISILLVGLILMMGLTACGGKDSKPTDSSVNQSVQPSDDQSAENEELESYKEAAVSKLDELVNPAVEVITNESLKSSIQAFYNTETQFIRSITDLETAKTAANKVMEDTKAYVNNDLKPLAVAKLSEVLLPLITSISVDDLKASAEAFLAAEIEKMTDVEQLEDLSNVFNDIVNDTKEYIQTETEKTLKSLKTKALLELAPYVANLVSMIPVDLTTVDIPAFFATEKEKLQAITSIDNILPCVNQIKESLVAYAFSCGKTAAVTKLEEMAQDALDKITNQELKDSLTAFTTAEIAKINAINSVEDLSSTFQTVLSEMQEFIQEQLPDTE